MIGDTMIGDKEGDTKVDGGAKADEGLTEGGGVCSSPTAGAGTVKENDLEDQVSSPRTDVGKGLLDLTPPKTVSGKGKEEVREGRVTYSSALVEGSSMADTNLEFVVEDGVAEAQNQTELSPPGNEANRVVNDSVIMEGSSLNEQTGRASKEIVTNLIAELKSVSEKENLSGGRVSVSQDLTIDCEEKVDCTDQEKWALVTGNSGMTSPAREVESCHSPNGFQILQDLQEEGEIADDDDSQSDTAEETVDEALEKNPKTDDVVGLTVKTLPPTNGGSKATTQRQNPVSRGRGRGSKRHKVKARDLVLVAAQQQKAAKLSIGCLIETRVKEQSFQKVFDATFPGWKFVHSYSNHRLGRIWVCYSDEVGVRLVSSSAQMITLWVKYKGSGDMFPCSFVYAFNHANERRELWREMEVIGRSAGQIPWIIQGDFNVALTSQEHSSFMNTRVDRNAIKDFQDVVLKCDMMDIAQVGPTFTWTNCQAENPISKKLDRVMANSSWINAFPQSFATFESGGVSDHLRMHIQLRDMSPSNAKPFKFFTNLTSHPRFLEVVGRIWHEAPPLFHSRAALGKLQEKLKALKIEMRGLNRDFYGDLPERVKMAFEDLCAKQTEAMQSPQTSTFEAASDAWEHWHHISGIEEQFYYQKSRVQWLGLGDMNSRFFHKVTQSRNLRNTIRRIVTSDGGDENFA
ncbi:hypothetical protein HID58_074093 [Brassica napus]|uniref:Endonuclease/exonuclease/phosphatase domain-containing protein n=1 Tax=Brassica napus TaxID=3708 RepID=A0ABQ7YIQ7_BRANA|nr:hypothetical protein HID58_074093 [Brassica napus]